MKILLRKTTRFIVSPEATQEEDGAIEFFDSIKVGSTISADIKRARNYRFLKKYFALLHLAFDYWDGGDSATAFKGEPVQKNFDRFRNDVQIVAGFGEPVWNLRGELRMQSRSISFGRMTEEEFEKVYSKVIDVLLDRVMRAKGFTREAIDALVDQLISFT